jgi:hypothetical protein
MVKKQLSKTIPRNIGTNTSSEFNDQHLKRLRRLKQKHRNVKN